MTSRRDFDVIVVGSGFGGSVATPRRTEKGYRVGVMEAGQRFDESTYPRTSWDVRRFLWAPRLGWLGLLRITILHDVLVFASASAGGGSLVYANTLYEPLPEFYDDPQWRHITDWRAELAPFYDQAKRMLSVTPNPTVTAADEAMRAVAEEMGVGDSFRPHARRGLLRRSGPWTGSRGRRPVLQRGRPRTAGLHRIRCLHDGCRHNAKNTLTKNYLYPAVRAGAELRPETTVTSVRPLAGGGYGVATRPTRGRPRRADDHRSPRRPSARWPSGQTRARPTRAHRWARRTYGLRTSPRTARSCPPTPQLRSACRSSSH